MASQLTEAMIVNGVVLVTVLASDLGRARKIGWLRIMRPLIAAAVIVPLFVITPVGHGTGLTIEFAGLAAGVLCGLGAGALMRVYRHPATGKPVSCVGAGYALLWLLIIGARTTFSYGAAHWFAGPLVRWAIANDVSAAALTDGLIFMAVAMVVMRAISLGVRAVRLAGTGLSAEPASGPAGERYRRAPTAVGRRPCRRPTATGSGRAGVAEPGRADRGAGAATASTALSASVA